MISSPLFRLKTKDLPVEIHGYEFTRYIGRGGFAECYLCRNISNNFSFCAKVLNDEISSNQKRNARLKREIASLIELNHPHVIRIYDYFIESNHLIMIFEYCSGGSLYKEITSSGGLSSERFLEVSREIIQALHFCHSHSIAHRDIKPENILLDDHQRAKLADFGLSIQCDGTYIHSSSGSSLFQPPEIFKHVPYDPFPADVWSLGVTFAYMLLGRSPWQVESPPLLMHYISKGNIFIKKQTPPEIADIIRKMVIVNPKQRITMEELANHPLFAVNPTPSTKLKYSRVHHVQATNSAPLMSFKGPGGELMTGIYLALKPQAKGRTRFSINIPETFVNDQDDNFSILN